MTENLLGLCESQLGALFVTGLRQLRSDGDDAIALAAIEAERKRIAAELHDGLGQGLVAVKYLVDAQIAHCVGDGVAAVLNTVSRRLAGLIEELREASLRLRPSLLDDLGLIAALRWLQRSCSTVSRKVKIDMRVDIDENQVGEALKLAVFRIVQEAINNFTRHARGDCLSVLLRRNEDRLWLHIEDNGMGFDVAAVTGGAGLRGMRERAMSTGGCFELASGAGGGTRIDVVWPGQRLTSPCSKA